jgi:two-component system OmpR family response regulator
MNGILIIEDDPVLGRGLSVTLELEGYRVAWVRDLKSAGEARASSKTPFDLVLLDLGLPDGSGFQFLKKLRATDTRTPVVILTAKTDEDSVVEGLQAGANDYVRKPFGNKELLARLKTALREPQRAGAQVRFGDLVVLPEQRKAMFGDKEIELHRREFDLLHYFVKHADAVVTREALLESLDKDGEIFDRTIDSHVSHVRARLRQAGVDSILISSVYGVGYRLEKRS